MSNNVKFTISGLGSIKNEIPYDMSIFMRNYSLNSGNLLFNFASDLITDNTLQKYSWGSKTANINADKNTYGLILPMANHIGKHVDLLENGPKVEGLQKPVVALGLGAQFELNRADYISEIPKGTLRWLDLVTKNKTLKNISVRGSFTGKLLSELGYNGTFEVLGCPSLLINPDMNLGCLIKEKFKKNNAKDKLKSLAIAAGNPYDPRFSNIEKSFISLVDDFSSMYVIQHPKLLIDMSMGYGECTNSSDLDVLSKQWFPTTDPVEIPGWFKQNSVTYVSVPQWFSDLGKRDFLVGTRIHGVQAAIQSGTLAVCLYVDSRTKELCESMSLPCASAEDFKDGVNIFDIFDIFDKWDYRQFDLNRKNLAKKTLSFLAENNVAASTHLIKMCEV